MKPEFLLSQALSHLGLELGDGEDMEGGGKCRAGCGVVEVMIGGLIHGGHKWQVLDRGLGPATHSRPSALAQLRMNKISFIICKAHCNSHYMT